MSYDIETMVKDKRATFIYFKNNELWYTTDDGFEFPVPIGHVGDAKFLPSDRAILFMYWIRQRIKLIESAKTEI